MDFATAMHDEMKTSAVAPRQPQGDLTMPKGRESRDRFSATGEVIRAKSNYIVCEECAEEREREEGPSAFHCCPCDPLVVVGFRTKAGPISWPSRSHCGSSDWATVELRTEAGPISCPSPEKSNPSPSAGELTRWTLWDWRCLCVHARLGMPTCDCYDTSSNSVMSTKKRY
ncbi:ANK_REP_REGION domain-containing protein [Psidium guajava]|nr:ANK_REP_REGION domain-containing protein [Psidium guajava]